jgi:hypothetical protein
MTKRELMENIYSPKELKNIDSAIPIELWDEHPPAYHVMNYNNLKFGKCENLLKLAKEKGLKL